MSYDWGPFFIVPSVTLNNLSGHVQLREQLDDDLLAKELDDLGLQGWIVKVANPWYFRKKGEETWIKIGESTERAKDFPVSWSTIGLENGTYEIRGIMQVTVKKEDGDLAIARENVMDVNITN